MLKSFLRSPSWERSLLLAGLAFVFLLTLIGFAWAGKNVTLVIDGQPHYLKTKAKTVGELLEENNLTVGEKDLIDPDKNESIRDGLKITIIRAKRIKLTVDGRSNQVEVAALRVKDVLRKLNIDYNPSKDKIHPLLGSSLYDGMEIKVTRLITRVIEVKKSVPFKVVKKASSRLAKGEKLIKNSGRPGLIVQTFEVTYLGNKKVSQKLKATKVVERPVDRLILVGSREKTKVKAGDSSKMDYSLALRRAVARGSRVLIMLATAYVPGYGCGYRTALGRRATYGVVAVDPRVIPLGTRLYIPGYGYAVAADTGGSIKGNRIDLCFNSLEQARNFGRRRVKVYLLR